MQFCRNFIMLKVVRISETSSGQINLKHLELVLESWKTTGLPLVGCFSAASNITGKMKLQFTK